MTKEITLVASGDSLITMRQSVHSEPDFMELVEMIRSADVAFTNHEMLLHDYEEDCYPAAQSGGTYTRADPSIITELRWMGYNLFSTANNHSLDYSYGGLFATKAYLEAAGVTYAGTGRDLAEARAPAYLDTAKGRVALIAACSTFAPFGRAGDSRRDMRGRPGLNPLRYDTWYEVRPETLERIRNVSGEMGIDGVVQSEDPDEFHFLRTKYVAGEDVGSHTKANKSDLEGNLESIREASRQADWVLFSLHAHGGAWKDTERPAEFMEEFARAAVDAGAHAVIGHGHHAMRGIEIREGRPIFYSLGDFIFQNQTVERMPADFYARYKLDPYSGTPADAYDTRTEPKPTPGRRKPSWFGDDEKYWISVVPRMRFDGDALDELRLYPIELGWEKPRSQRGRPMLARGELADKIIGIMAGLSEPYGTEVLNRDGVGVVSL